jgi:ketosteroid isomerase-like protein
VSEFEEKLRLYFNALNAFDFKAVEEMFTEDAVYVSTGLNNRKSGRASIMASFKTYFEEFADQVSIDDNIESISQNTFCSDWRLKATSSKTGNLSERAGTQVTTFNEAGLIAHVKVRDEV